MLIFILHLKQNVVIYDTSSYWYWSTRSWLIHFILMDIPYHSDDAKIINKNIFETIYHASLEKSCEIATLYVTMI